MKLGAEISLERVVGLIGSDRLRLVLLSGLMLFVELALIRWTGSNIVYLSYFSNFVLLGSFLGIGVGFLRARAQGDVFRWAPIVLASFVIFVLAVPVHIDRSGSELIYFGASRTTGLPTWVMLPIVFVAVALVMALIAQEVARTFARFEALEAYRLDVLGSILGIVAFSGLAFLRAPPITWGVVSGALFLLLLAPRIGLVHIVAVAAMAGALLVETVEPGSSWSPYYRIQTSRGSSEVWFISANGIPHQNVASLSVRRRLEPIYFEPYERTGGAPDDVLIIGAGTGTDVAVALAEGASSVDAVEIDPRIQEIGRELHPDRPYQDPRVVVTIDDGRAFLERTHRRYDMIVFALPDSLTLVSGQSSLRLESYLFTVEAFREARNHLEPEGVFAMYNFYREEWLVARLAATLEEVFGRPPCVSAVGEEGRLALLMSSQAPEVIDCDTSTLQLDTTDAPPPSTDDHPFLYLRSRTIPSFYLLTLAMILGASVLIIRAAGGPFRRMKSYLDLFSMGVAFLLLETKSVVQFALLFGTTWFVNALVFAGVLLSVLLAIEVARHVRFRRPVVMYAALIAAIGLAYVVPQHALLDLSFLPRFGAATALAFAPIFLANLVFAERFRAVGDSTTAFGANLLGAMIGGVLEYAALITGYRALLIVVAVVYGLAFVFGRRPMAVVRPSA